MKETQTSSLLTPTAMDRFPDVERTHSTASTLVADAPADRRVSASRPTASRVVKAAGDDTTSGNNLIDLQSQVAELAAQVGQMTESLKALSQVVSSAMAVPPAVTRTSSTISASPPPVFAMTKQRNSDVGGLHRGMIDDAPLSDAAPTSRGHGHAAAGSRSRLSGPPIVQSFDNIRDDASNRESTTDRKSRKKWLGRTTSNLVVSADQAPRTRSVFDVDFATGRVAPPPIVASAAPMGAQSQSKQRRSITGDTVRTAKSAANPLEQSQKTSTGDEACALGDVNPHSSPTTGTTRISRARDLGLSEDEPIIMLLDVMYILIAIACSMLTITAINPRNDVLESPWLFDLCIVVNAFSSVFTVIWIASRFFVRNRNGEWEIVDEIDELRVHYRQTWFPFDLLYGVPIDYIFAGWNWHVYFYFQVRHFLRLVRLLFLGASGNPLRESRTWFKFVAFCVAYLLILHSVANGFGAIENYNYIDSLYWTVLTMATVGYGDIVPTTNGGKVYCIISMLLGITLMSVLTAFATQFLTQKDKLKADIDEKKSLMNAMLTYYEVPWEIQRDVIRMFPTVLDAQSESSFRQLGEGMPVFVAKQIDQYARAKVLRAVPLFQAFKEPESILQLSQLLTRRFIPERDFIVVAGEVGREMFFIVRGVVEVLITNPEDSDEEVVVATLKSGDFFGEIALLEDVVRTASVQAVTLCEVWVLEKQHLDQLTEIRRDLRAILTAESDNRRAAMDNTMSKSRIGPEVLLAGGANVGDATDDGRDSDGFELGPQNPFIAIDHDSSGRESSPRAASQPRSQPTERAADGFSSF